MSLRKLYKIPYVQIDIKEMESFTSEDDFNYLLVELFKEFSQILIIIVNLYEKQEGWNRNEAIIGGLLVRLIKLHHGFLDQIVKHRLEIAYIMLRLISETIINVGYLLKYGNEKLYDEYIGYSLSIEKEWFDDVNNNIEKRNEILPIENRMTESIFSSFKLSNFSIDNFDIKKYKYKGWKEKSMKKRMRDIGYEEDAYKAMFELPSHAIHGNWQDLISQQLEERNGKFFPKFEWSVVRPQIISGTLIFVLSVIRDNIEKIIDYDDHREEIVEMLNDIMERTLIVDAYHEKYLINKG